MDTMHPLNRKTVTPTRAGRSSPSPRVDRPPSSPAHRQRPCRRIRILPTGHANPHLRRLSARVDHAEADVTADAVRNEGVSGAERGAAPTVATSWISARSTTHVQPYPSISPADR